MRRTWVTRIDGVDHRIELEHGVWNGRRSLRSDGREVHEGRKLLDLGEDIHFVVAGHQGLVRIAPNGLGYAYGFAIDGRWVQHGSLVVALPRLLAVSGYALMAHALVLFVLAGLAPVRDGVDLLFIGARALVAIFVALQLFGGRRWGWLAALAYVDATLVLAIASVAGSALFGTRLDNAAALPADVRTSLGLVLDVALAVAIAAPLLAPSVRAFFQPRRALS